MTYKIILRVDTDETTINRLRDLICDVLCDETNDKWEIAVEGLKENAFISFQD